MAASHRPATIHRWLFPLLVALLVLGHACELPAYAGLIATHAAGTGAATPVEHDHDGDEHALACDGALVLPGPLTTELNPESVMALAAPPAATPAPRPGPRPTARPIKSSAGPPLFLLFSSLLI
jgi:hypothetical protein